MWKCLFVFQGFQLFVVRALEVCRQKLIYKTGDKLLLLLLLLLLWLELFVFTNIMLVVTAAVTHMWTTGRQTQVSYMIMLISPALKLYKINLF
jgi:hypothetical protein